MKTTQYLTGRNYGTAQILTITAPAIANDEWDLIEVAFEDAARGIAGTVRVFGIDLDQVGPAVLREYDAGRYSLR